MTYKEFLSELESREGVETRERYERNYNAHGIRHYHGEGAIEEGRFDEFILSGFFWAESPEEHDFWSKLYYKWG